MDKGDLIFFVPMVAAALVFACYIIGSIQCEGNPSCKYKEEISFCESVYSLPFNSAHHIDGCDIVVCGQWDEKVVERFCG